MFSQHILFGFSLVCMFINRNSYTHFREVIYILSISNPFTHSLVFWYLLWCSKLRDYQTVQLTENQWNSTSIHKHIAVQVPAKCLLLWTRPLCPLLLDGHYFRKAQYIALYSSCCATAQSTHTHSGFTSLNFCKLEASLTSCTLSALSWVCPLNCSHVLFYGWAGKGFLIFLQIWRHLAQNLPPLPQTCAHEGPSELTTWGDTLSPGPAIWTIKSALSRHPLAL